MAKDKKKEAGDSPFAALKELLAPKEVGQEAVKQPVSAPAGTTGRERASGGRRSSAVFHGSAASGGNDALSEDEDAALFFSAVRNVKPRSKERGNTAAGIDMGEVFAALGGTDRKGHRSKPAGSDLQRPRSSSPEVVGKDAHLGAAAEDTGLFEAAMGLDPEASERERQKRRKSEEELFAKAMAGVAPVEARGREVIKPVEDKNSKAPAPVDVMREILEGRIEFALHNTDEYIEGHVVGVDPMIIGRLRAGEFSPEAHIDLHGQNADQAYAALTGFLKNAYQRNMRTVIVITGRGKNSPSGIGVIRSLLQTWLTRDPFKRVVLGFCSARPHDGGAGAVYVLLRKYKKNRGKIRWDIPFHGPDEA